MNKRSLASAAVVIMSLGVAGCARTAPLTVDRIEDVPPIVATDKNVVLINHTQWDLDVRRALVKAGFNVKRFASVNETRVTGGDVSKTFNEAEARYGITQYPGGPVDWCIGAKAVKYEEFALEVADLRTNNVVFTVQKGGWTGDCGFSGGRLFEELAEALRENWK